MTNWYQLPRKTILGLILIILRSSTVIKITAGKIFHMSISTFGDVSIVKKVCVIKFIYYINYKIYILIIYKLQFFN